MTWVRVSDDFMDHPKVLDLGADAPVAVTLWLAGLGYCNRYLTDGELPRDILPRLTAMAPGEVMHAADALVSVGLWEQTPRGYHVHDFLDYQPSRKQVLHARGENKRRNKEWRDARRDGARDGVMDTAPTPTQTHIPNPTPTPSRDQPEVVVVHRELYGKEPTSAKVAGYRRLTGKYGEERVGAALRSEYNLNPDPSNILTRMESGLKTGDELRRLEAAS